MKKYLSILALTAIATGAFAQGTLIFGNNGSTLVRQGGTSTTDASATAVAANGAVVELAWAASSATYVPWNVGMNETAWLAANPGWAVLTGPVNIAPIAGRFSGGTFTANTAPAGALIQAVVLGWTGGGSFDAAWASGTSYTAIGPAFTVQTGNPTTTPPGTAAPIVSSTATPFTGLTLVQVPEPATFALAGLGAAALFIFRRRK